MNTAASQRRAIKILPTLVANQIAAGEVVERPASVVKELLENALDSGATRIVVDLEQGGTELIRVTDDGSGIPRDELPLAVAPHATSKIEHVDDLDRIGTLGFRGEALASIAAVSRLSIRSRTRDEAGACVISMEGGAASPVQPAAGAVGTSVTVRNLFFNTPARRKFLRTVGTEQERCVEVVRHAAMAHPGVGLCMTADGRTLFDYPPGQLPRDRALAILGKELSGQLIEVHADEFDDSRGLALWGLAGHPSIARGTNKHQSIFINGRPVRDRTVQHAIVEAYRGLIEPSLPHGGADAGDVGPGCRRECSPAEDRGAIPRWFAGAFGGAAGARGPSAPTSRPASMCSGPDRPVPARPCPAAACRHWCPRRARSLERFVDSLRRPPEPVQAQAPRRCAGRHPGRAGGQQPARRRSTALPAWKEAGVMGVMGVEWGGGGVGVVGSGVVGERPLLDARPPSACAGAQLLPGDAG